MYRAYRLIAICLILFSLVGCNHNVNTTPQYQAAITVNDISSSLVVFQQADIKAYHMPGQTYYPKDVHNSVEFNMKKAAQLNDEANAKVATGDFTGAIGIAQSVVSLLQDTINSDIIQIKDANTAASLRAAANGIIGIAQITISTWQSVKTGGK